MKWRVRQLVGMCANGNACPIACRAAESTDRVSAREGDGRMQASLCTAN